MQQTVDSTVGGHRGHLSLYSHVTAKPIKESPVVTCGFLREMQRDRVKSGGREVMDGTAAVLWFQVEIVQGRREEGTAWTTRQLGLLGFHEAGA